MKRFYLPLLASCLANTALAHDPEILDVKVEKMGMMWSIHVTLQHGDTGWDHYADGWVVMDVEGNVLATRKLHHPHVEEQPFTRSLHSLVLPDGTREIRVKARCSVDDWSDQVTKVILTP
ncbi:hypothetical protein [Roseovarius sp. EL26]|uniref:hypothetical protein n=1 Tax=Roseovarius sp. EL26 TaxID=2126672 RepID=UPI000EA22200|nr:hypothetical protein [Roseovarius sp. EL26]